MYLYGASGHAKVILEILELSGIKINGLFDDNPLIKDIIGYPCFGPFIGKVNPEDKWIISIGNNLQRKQISEKYSFSYGIAIHPSSVISSRVIIGDGTVIMGNAIINTGTEIGCHAIINTSASVDHDCRIGDFVHISPNATLCGGVSVGEGTQVGAAAVIIPNINIGKWVTIGAGAVVICDVPDYSVVVGNPGRIIKTGKSIQ
ncbi:MAG: acetyltransferase [Bacteroidetes bacterium HGW-Bacteroidetes-11]|jgi:acetyltransferase EpsM|nr:MAG: acetyltransferase [Bacteroidetes bacterium HGW-Bacteroidetes-11]